MLPVKVSVPVPVFVTLIPSGATEVPACVVKLKLVAFTARTEVVAGGGVVVIFPMTPAINRGQSARINRAARPLCGQGSESVHAVQLIDPSTRSLLLAEPNSAAGPENR